MRYNGQMRVAGAVLSIACWAGLALGCDELSEPATGTSSFGFAGRGGSVPPSQPMSVPVAPGQGASVPVGTASPAGSAMGPPIPGDVSTCEGGALENGRGFANRACADCLCEIAPMATFACTRDCWTLAFCVASSGCASGDANCLVSRCNATGDSAGFTAVFSLTASVPFQECLPECFGDPNERPERMKCEGLRADVASAQVGESIVLSWDAAVGEGEYSLSLVPWASVASLHEVDGRTELRCDAPGVVAVEIESDRCNNTPLALELECVARPDSSCCPIEPLSEAGFACSELGGSPPCHVGCNCLRDGGAFYTELDAQGCLQWVLRPTIDSDEHLVCLDQAGNPSPDPRNAP